MNYREVEIAHIVIGDKRRAIKAEAVEALAQSIKEIGLQNPISLTDGMRLIGGRKRLEAFKKLGHKTIPATFHSLDVLRAEIAELDENLVRDELSPLERAASLKRRKEIWESLYPETKVGGAPGKAGGGKVAKNDKMSSFAQDAAEKTGQSRRTIERDVAIAEAIPEDVQETIADTPVADKKSELQALAKLPEADQRKAAKKIASGKAATVAEAAKPSKAPAEASVEDRMKESNSRLESVARKIAAMADDEILKAEPHIDATRLDILRSQLKAAANTVRCAKGAAVCSYCNGKRCKNCLQTGWLTREKADSAPQKD